MKNRPHTPATMALRLADAAWAIARADHYLVGFNRHEIDGVSWDDFSDAHRILVDRELKTTAKGTADLAFRVLNEECNRQHNCNAGG